MARANPILAGGAILAGTGVALGAFGVHALRNSLSAEQLGWWQTGVQYQIWHGLALVALGAAGSPLRWAPRLLGFGALFFAATLYAMALGGPRWLGAVTPLGGLAMLAGWAWLAWAGLRPQRSGASG